MELRFTVWQFVRLMVRLEQHPDALFESWCDVWQDLDTSLTTLAENDPSTYGETMMDKEVVLDNATTEQAFAAKTALEAVMVEIESAIKMEGEPESLQSLKFERRELRQLTRKLGRLSSQNKA